MESNDKALAELMKLVGWVSSNVSHASVLIPLGVAGYIYLKKKVKQPLGLREIIIFSMISLISDSVSLILVKKGYNNLPVINTFPILSFIILSVLYRKLLLKKSAPLIYTFVFIFFAFELYNTFFAQGFTEHQSWSWVFWGLIMCLFSLKHYQQIYKDDKFFISLYDHTPYWISTGVFLYFGFSLWVFAVDVYINSMDNEAISYLIWSSHNLNNIIRNVVFTIALFVACKEPKSLLDEYPYKRKGYFDE